MKLIIFALFAVALCDPWVEFQATHNKVYSSKMEAAKRMRIFLSNLAEVQAHNAAGSYEQGINKFSDLTFDEFASVYLMAPQAAHVEAEEVSAVTPIDWRSRGAVGPIKDQGSCGSCYAFGANGAIEGRGFLAFATLFNLAEQQCVDCSSGYGNLGCNGGMPERCMSYYAAAGGVMQTKNYPYTARKGSCVFNKTLAAVSISGPSTSTGEASLQQQIAAGPTALCLYATSAFQRYSSGIFTDTTCPNTTINHALIGVGLGMADGKDFYIIKNSWGTSWGESGYIRFQANNRNMCDVGGANSWPNNPKKL